MATTNRNFQDKAVLAGLTKLTGMIPPNKGTSEVHISYADSMMATVRVTFEIRVPLDEADELLGITPRLAASQ